MAIERKHWFSIGPLAHWNLLMNFIAALSGQHNRDRNEMTRKTGEVFAEF
jgi:hypothetical protein